MDSVAEEMGGVIEDLAVFGASRGGRAAGWSGQLLILKRRLETRGRKPRDTAGSSSSGSGANR